VKWFGRRSGAGAPPGGRRPKGIDAETFAHVQAFATSRRGVEAYVEPRTTVTETTVVFVAHDGEWTRRRVPDPPEAARLARQLGIPIYDVHATGYPPRMRAWSSAQKSAARAGGTAAPTAVDDADLPPLD
jgi:hypothetical protein